jgi:hypothetical protein
LRFATERDVRTDSSFVLECGLIFGQKEMMNVGNATDCAIVFAQANSAQWI